MLSAGLKRIGDAAEAYAGLLPLMSGEAGGLDFRTRAALLGDPRTTPLVAARILAGVGRHAEAATGFRLALSLPKGSPGSVSGTAEEPAARVQLATVLTAGGEPAEALAAVEQLLAGAPGGVADPAPAAAAAALVLQKALGDLNRGGEVVDRLVSLQGRFPDDLGVAVSLAAARAEAGDLEQAENELAALVVREPAVLVSLAGVRRLRGDAAGWMEAVARAAALGLDDADAERTAPPATKPFEMQC